MAGYLIRRLFEAIIVLIVVMIIIFLIMRVLPGDPISLFVSRGEISSYSQEQISALKHEYGLDKPLVIQFFDWLGGILHGDLGKSIFKQQNVATVLAQRLPTTLYLGTISLILSIIIGIFLGVIAAVRRGTWLDAIATFTANIGITAPIFWVGILMIYLFGMYLHWLPIYGFEMPFNNFTLSVRQTILPVICLTLFSLASIARQTRSSMLEIIRQDYIRTAWSKGLSEKTIVTRHALKNGLIPVVTLAGTQVRNIVGGAVLVETVFNIPGMGRLAVESIFNHDYAVVQGVVLTISIMVIISNLLVDLSYSWIDPRVRYT